MKKVGIIAGFAAAAAAVLLGASLVVTYPNEYKLIRDRPGSGNSGSELKSAFSPDRDFHSKVPSDL